LPITIYKSDTSERVDWICDDDWELPSQIEELSVWLKRNCDQLKPANYVADIGFDIRRYAWGGGVVQSVESMRIMCVFRYGTISVRIPRQRWRIKFNKALPSLQSRVWWRYV